MIRKNKTKQRALPQTVQDFLRAQAELETQNIALRYSQTVAEGASERFQTLFSNVPLALMVVDEQGLILEGNARALSLFRPLEIDAPLSFLFPLVGEVFQNTLVTAFEQAKHRGTSETTELVFFSGSAAFFTGDLHIARIENQQDELAHFICAIIDQSPLLAQRQALQSSTHALHQRNEELQRSKDRLAAIINSSLDAIICIDPAQKITVFNPAAAALFKCTAATAIGLPLDSFLPDLTPARLSSQIASREQFGKVNGRTSRGELVYVDASLSFEHHPDGDIRTIFARDITEQKRIEAHRNRLESQLRESHKMQAIGTMAGGIAHDFNNIIGAILGNVGLALQDTKECTPAWVSLNEIDKAGRRARDLVRQILTFSRNESSQKTQLQLADVIRETSDLIKVTLPPYVKMTFAIDPNTPPVLGDATQIGQAVLNLLTNAIQAIGSQAGSIEVSLAYQQNSNLPHPERRQGVRGKHVQLTVRDTGCGIAPDKVSRIFEPFFTTKEVGQGTGLGLAVVHGIMRSHQGNVEVQSAPNAGSVFTLSFPVPANAKPAAPLIEVRPQPKPALGGGGKHIMYVDDDDALLFLVQRALTRKGFEVSAFKDPLVAVAALRAQPLAFDLLVTDYNMPGYSGLEVLKEARLIRAEMPVAMASGYITQEIEENARAAGARALIYKPNDVDEMCEALERLLRPG